MFLKKFDKAFVLIAIIVLMCFSFFYLGDRYSRPETYKSTIQTIDKKKNNVLGLVGSSTALSTAISFLPDDVGTPLANQLADLSTYLMIILSVLYTEKYLLTVIGYAVFKVLIPIALAGTAIGLFINSYGLKRFVSKIAAVSLVLFLVIPTSVKITDMIDETYQTSMVEEIEELVEDAEKTEEEVEVQTEANEQENTSFLSRAKKAVSNAANAVADAVQNTGKAVAGYTKKVVEKIGSAINRFIEATAVMLVTSCVIPILTLFAFSWFIRLILDLNVESPNLIKTKNKIRKTAREAFTNQESFDD